MLVATPWLDLILFSFLFIILIFDLFILIFYCVPIPKFKLNNQPIER